MTEEDAKTKWCFKFQVATSGGDSGTFETDNRPAEHKEIEPGKWRPTGEIHPTARCIGSACMAWRWLPQEEQTRGQSYARPDESDPPPLGFCGLAGKP